MATAALQTPSIGWLTPSVAVGLFGFLVLAAGVVLCWWAYRREMERRRNSYRRAALVDLDELVPRLYDEGTRQEALAKLAILLKRTALQVYPSEEVAPLSGAAWLVFLARTSGEQDFTRRLGQMFVAAVFNPKATGSPSREECEQIADLARRWIVKHRA
jgi:hypothetical protein